MSKVRLFTFVIQPKCTDVKTHRDANLTHPRLFYRVDTVQLSSCVTVVYEVEKEYR